METDTQGFQARAYVERRAWRVGAGRRRIHLTSTRLGVKKVINFLGRLERNISVARILFVSACITLVVLEAMP